MSENEIKSPGVWRFGIRNVIGITVHRMNFTVFTGECKRLSEINLRAGVNPEKSWLSCDITGTSNGVPYAFTWQVHFTEAGRFANESFRERPVRHRLLSSRLRNETSAAYVHASFFSARTRKSTTDICISSALIYTCIYQVTDQAKEVRELNKHIGETTWHVNDQVVGQMTRRRNDRKAEVKLFLTYLSSGVRIFPLFADSAEPSQGFWPSTWYKKIHLSYTSFIRLKLLANLQRATDKQGQSSN